jgi:hypothetical protein
MDVLSDMITTINLIIVGVSLFSYFAFTSPEPCPRKYRVLQEDGGILTNYGQIHQYCELDYGHKWKLKKERNE